MRNKENICFYFAERVVNRKVKIQRFFLINFEIRQRNREAGGKALLLKRRRKLFLKKLNHLMKRSTCFLPFLNLSKQKELKNRKRLKMT